MKGKTIEINFAIYLPREHVAYNYYHILRMHNFITKRTEKILNFLTFSQQIYGDLKPDEHF